MAMFVGSTESKLVVEAALDKLIDDELIESVVRYSGSTLFTRATPC